MSMPAQALPRPISGSCRCRASSSTTASPSVAVCSQRDWWKLVGQSLDHGCNQALEAFSSEPGVEDAAPLRRPSSHRFAQPGGRRPKRGFTRSGISGSAAGGTGPACRLPDRYSARVELEMARASSRPATRHQPEAVSIKSSARQGAVTGAPTTAASVRREAARAREIDDELRTALRRCSPPRRATSRPRRQATPRRPITRSARSSSSCPA